MITDFCDATSFRREAAGEVLIPGRFRKECSTLEPFRFHLNG